MRKFGSDFALKVKKEMSNPFWEDVLKHYLQINSKCETSNWHDFLEQPILFNPKIKRDKESIYLKEWADQNILKVKDIINTNGELISFQTFKEKYPSATKTNFILYQGIANAVRKYLRSKNWERDTVEFKNTNKLWFIILSNNDNVKSTILKNKNLPTAVAKWNCSFVSLNWKTIF